MFIIRYKTNCIRPYYFARLKKWRGFIQEVETSEDYQWTAKKLKTAEKMLAQITEYYKDRKRLNSGEDYSDRFYIEEIN